MTGKIKTHKSGKGREYVIRQITVSKHNKDLIKTTILDFEKEDGVVLNVGDYYGDYNYEETELSIKKYVKKFKLD